MNLLGLDVGSTGCKAIIFDPEGKILGSGFKEYGMIYDDRGKAEQDAEEIWTIVCDVIKIALKSSGSNHIKALSASVQGDGIIAVDSSFKPLHNAILGMDYRSKGFAAECGKIFGEKELFDITGMRPHPMNSLTKLLWFKNSFPGLFSKTDKITTYSDFILRKFTGKNTEPVIDNTMASRTMAYDIHHRRFSADILQKLDLDGSIFSRPAPSGTVIGTVSKDLMEEFGLKGDTEVVTGGHDQTCAAIGAGIIKEGIGLISTGTAEVMSSAFNKPRLDENMFKSYYPCYIHAKDDMFFTFSLNHVGGLLFKWFRDNFAQKEIQESRSGNIDTYEYLTNKMPKRPTDIFFLPHLNGSGTPLCDLSSKGAIVGLKVSHDKYDIVRAILESLSYELKINIEAMSQADIKLEAFNSVGGGSKSSQWLQIKADILEKDITTLKNPEAACLGAAILAGFGSGVYETIKEGVGLTVKKDRTFSPDPAMVEKYRYNYGIYKDLYPSLRDINNRLG